MQIASQHEKDCLPSVVITSNGVRFDARPNIWDYREATAKIRFDFAKVPLDEMLMQSFKKTLIWYAENKKPMHLHNLYHRFKHFARFTAGSEKTKLKRISASAILNYKASLIARRAWYVGTIRGLLVKWDDLGLPGVDSDAVALLKELRIPGNQKGEAVRTMDPYIGAYSDIEFEAIHLNLTRAYEDGDISLGEYLLVWLFCALGQRPIQYSLLKVRDLISARLDNGATSFVLRVPRCKQRGENWRSSFTDRMLVSHIGELFLQYMSDVIERFGKRVADPTDLPLFPTANYEAEFPSGYQLHQTAEEISECLTTIVQRLLIRSERTGKPLHVAAVRFRRTLGTRAAAEGHGELVIAALLDHTDTQNVRVYIEMRPEFIERINKAVSLKLAPLAQAFAGVIISDESEASRKGDSASRICAPQADPSMRPVGNCGKYGFCGLLAPIACYTCRHFQAWLDAPHPRILQFLINERARLGVVTDSRIAAIDDRTILAVQQVILECEKRKKSEDSNRGD